MILSSRRIPRLRPILLALLLSATSAVTSAIGQAPNPIALEPDGEELTVYLMTMGPGSAFWERFGHNAIWVRDDLRRTNIAYNYGMFSFDQENFFLRFIRGQMDYWMQGDDAEWMANIYIQANRSVWAQQLNLSPAQRVAVRDFLEWNAREENRFYRYDYYYDNCSTRVRDVIDQAVGGQLRALTEGVPAGTTFRQHTRALTATDPLLYSGLMLGLGQPVDRPITAWEEMFLPMELREWVRGATIRNEAGELVPLVVEEIVIFDAGTPQNFPVPASRVWIFLLIGLVFAAGIVSAGERAARWGGSRAPFLGLTMGWALLAGTLGLVLVGLWAFTDHATSYRNENILHFSPLLLALVPLLPAAVRGSWPAMRAAALLAVSVAAISVGGLLFQLLPGFSQMNGELIALALPINLAVALVLVRILRARGPGGVAAADRSAAEKPVAAAA